MAAIKSCGTPGGLEAAQAGVAVGRIAFSVKSGCDSRVSLFSPMAKTSHLASVTVRCGGTVPAEGAPVCATFGAPLPEELALVELVGAERIPVAVQVDPVEPRCATWLVAARAGAPAVREYELMRMPGTPWPRVGGPALEDAAGVLSFRDGERELLGYRYAVQPAPAGVDAVFARGGFIHPLLSPAGAVLTRIQPPDHYHHYGVWSAWTRVEVGGREVDFWNLGKGEASVRFRGFAQRADGPVFAQATSELEHVVLEGGGVVRPVLFERQTLRTYRMLAADAYLLDLTLVFRCAARQSVALLDYRYGGLAWRATADWDRSNSTVLTSEGCTRREADGSRARWCLVQGAVNGGRARAGAAVLVSPANVHAPEPLRVWPEEENGRGDVFVNLSPTKGCDWVLEPDRDHELRYRWLVFDGSRSADDIEAAWSAYARGPSVDLGAD